MKVGTKSPILPHHFPLKWKMIKRKYKRGECYGITWFDAFSPGETWTSNVDIDVKDKYVVFSVGFFYGESKEYVIIIGDVAPGTSGRIMFIPKGMIKKVKKFK